MMPAVVLGERQTRSRGVVDEKLVAVTGDGPLEVVLKSQSQRWQRLVVVAAVVKSGEEGSAGACPSDQGSAESVVGRQGRCKPECRRR